MKSYTVQTNLDQFENALEALKQKDMQLVILFSSKTLLKNNNLAGKVKDVMPDVQLLGCSTSGEIGDRVENDTIVLMGMRFDKGRFQCASLEIPDVSSSFAAGQALAKELYEEDISGIFVLLPGLNVNGSKFTQGMKDILPPHVSVSGGMAGDGLDFKDTLTVSDSKVASDIAVGFAVYGADIKMSTGSRGGWKPFGPQRHVTKVDGNILYEIDGRPALDLYKDYLGEKASDLPSSGLLYPFAIMNSENAKAVGLIRTILDINEEDKSLVLAGDMEVGQLVCLMHADTDELVDGAEEAARAALNDAGSESSDAVICVSCVGRKIVMGDDTEDELDAVKSVFVHDNIGGFYSYGEISMFQDTGEPELHNQTMTITYISENAA